MAQTLSTVSAPASVLLRSSPLVRRLLVLGLVAHLVVAAVCVGWPGGHIGDFTRYWELATSPGRPYLDVAAEYPPGALAVFSLLAGLSRHLADFVLLAQGVNLLADAAIVTTIAWAWGLEAATFYLVASLPLLSLLYFRMDLWSMAAVTGAVACWTRGRGVTSAAALAAGAALKLWPLPFAIILLRGARTSPRPLLAFALLVSAGLGAWVLWSGVGGVLQVLTFRGATGWDIESSVGSLWRLGADAPLRNEAGTLRIGWTLPSVSVGLFLVGILLALWVIDTGARGGRIGAGWIGGIGAVLACSALLSPQFVGWLFPGAAIAWREGDRTTAVWVAGLAGLTLVYRLFHPTQVPGLVLLRNALLAALVLRTLGRLRVSRT